MKRLFSAGRLIRFPPGAACRQLGRENFPTGSEWISYCLLIRLIRVVEIEVGRLGFFIFPAGNYIYTGSAKKNIRARVNRHLRREKRLRWHIDYLLTAAGVEVEAVLLSARPECELVALGGGEIVVPGFGASDCRAGCGSHLRRLTNS